jgi:hypothetical protein
MTDLEKSALKFVLASTSDPSNGRWLSSQREAGFFQAAGKRKGKRQ